MGMEMLQYCQFVFPGVTDLCLLKRSDNVVLKISIPTAFSTVMVEVVVSVVTVCVCVCVSGTCS